MLSSNDQDLVGREPQVFNGDRTLAESFAQQWYMFDALNYVNTHTPYQWAMLFLTYMQGPLVDSWVREQCEWIRRNQHGGDVIPTYIGLAFKRRFKDTLAKERARATLRQGISMFGWDVDEYVTTFKSLVSHGEYDLHEPLTVDVFIDGIPLDLFEVCYNHDAP